MEIGHRMFIQPGKLDHMYVFTVMLHSVPVIDVALRKDISYVALYQLIYRPAPVCSPVVGDHCPKVCYNQVHYNEIILN